MRKQARYTTVADILDIEGLMAELEFDGANSNAAPFEPLYVANDRFFSEIPLPMAA